MREKFTRVCAFFLSAAVLFSGTAFARETDDRLILDGGTDSLKAAGNPGYFYQTDHADAASNNSAIALPEAGTYMEGELLVKVESAVSLMDSGIVFDGIAAKTAYLFSVPAGGDNEEVSLASADQEMADWYRLWLTDSEDLLETWGQLSQMDGILAVQPNYIYQLDDPDEGAAAAEAISDVTEEDPYIHSQEWLEQIHAPDAWNAVETPGRTSSGDSIVVAVVDTGVDLEHPDLEGQLVTGRNFVETEADGETVTPADDPDDQGGHGTHIAGIIAAANNSIGVRGVAYDAKIMPVRVLDARGSGSGAEIANGIQWAAENGADIINLSLGGFGNSALEEDAIAYARSRGVLVVAAAGNESFPTAYAGDSYYGSSLTPANIPGVLTVMAMEKTAGSNGDWLASFSNYDADPGEGAEYEIMAPGRLIMSTYMGGGYGTMSGTSMACPVVAGAAAVLMGMGCTAEEAWEILVASGDVEQGKTQPDDDHTVRYYPALNLEAAVEMKRANSSPAVPVVANEWVYASLDSVKMSASTVDLSSLNTSSRVYYKASSFLSSLFVELENFGATGNMTVSGTVGGIPIRQQTVVMKTGDTSRVKLSLTDTPVVTNNLVTVSLTITPEGGTPVTLERSFLAYDFTLPSSIYYSGGYYYLRSSSVTVSGSTNYGYQALCLDRPLVINLGQTLVVEGGLIYLGADGAIQTNYNQTTSEESTFIAYGAGLLGTTGVHITGSGYNAFYGCYIYDPDIDFAYYVNQCHIEGNGYSGNKYLLGYSFYLSTFENCDDLIIHCAFFQRNLVNRCAFSTLYVKGLAQANSFIENYNPFYSSSVLQAYVPDYQASSSTYYNTYRPACDAYECYSTGGVTGLRYCSVVGPMQVSLYSDTGSAAKVYGIYYQKADDPYLLFDDAFSCASGSTVSSSVSSLANWGFASDSPVFATGVDVDAQYRSEYDCVDYTLTYTLSTAASEDTDPYIYSYSNPMDSNAEVTLSADGKTCTAKVTAPDLSLDMTDDYHLAGICTADKSIGTNSDGSTAYHYFWATELCGQVSTAGIHLYSTALEAVQAELDSSNQVILTWSDARITSGASAQIYRTMDGGDELNLGTVSTSSDGRYVDSGADLGHTYTYTVEISQNGHTYHGTASIVLPDAPANSLFLTISGNCITASLMSPQMENCLSYTVPSAAAKRVTFSEQVKDSGLPYGAIDNGDGTTTIYIGEEHSDAAILQADELFTLTPVEGMTYLLVDGVGAAVVSERTVSIWNTENCFGYLAGYAQDGKQKAIVRVSGTAITASAPNCTAWKLFRLNSETHTPEFSAIVLYHS